MLDMFEKSGVLKPGMDVVEGTSGSTGIALAYQCNARGYPLHIVMPDDQAMEKRQVLKNLGANVVVVPACAISSKDHYVNTARRLAEKLGGVFINQFENVANYQVHYKVTGPEIWHQLQGKIDGFVMSSGTGGTIAGVSR
jgi:cysteine synthase A